MNGKLLLCIDIAAVVLCGALAIYSALVSVLLPPFVIIAAAVYWLEVHDGRNIERFESILMKNGLTREDAQMVAWKAYYRSIFPEVSMPSSLERQAGLRQEHIDYDKREELL